MHESSTESQEPQRIKVFVDVLPGPLTEALAGRLLHLVAGELLDVGADVTAVGVEIHGDMASW
jgi:hypothetical protein